MRWQEMDLTKRLFTGYAAALLHDGVYLAALAKRMDHPALRLMPDFGKMKLDDPYGGTVAMMP